MRRQTSGPIELMPITQKEKLKRAFLKKIHEKKIIGDMTPKNQNRFNLDFNSEIKSPVEPSSSYFRDLNMQRRNTSPEMLSLFSKERLNIDEKLKIAFRHKVKVQTDLMMKIKG